MKRNEFIKHSILAGGAVTLLSPASVFLKACTSEQRAGNAGNLKYVTVASRENRFLGWPANNGLWSWDGRKEILVGFSDGEYIPQEGHNIGPDPLSRLARSLDGGHSWTFEEPKDYVRTDRIPVASPGGLNFLDEGFAMRVTSLGYHAASDSIGYFQVSYDRGRTWSDPYRFNGLNEHPELKGMELTARTNYQVLGQQSCLIMMAARNPQLEYASRLDKAFVAQTDDGGQTFQFISWIVPWTDNYRAVMPSSVRLTNGHLIIAARRRNPRNIEQDCWIDSFISEDNGLNWRFLSRVADTGLRNGNPPALHQLTDGRLVCCYANRTVANMLVRISSDGGKTWGDERVIRENPLDNDLGYPQLIQNHLGELVAIYYLADENRPVSFIEAAIWKS